ncbi:MAG TPA: DUF4870 domain-containing protein [Edaphobacter sp.]|jgi:uncharacterized membrane protein|nr:DUF4870 domain-containing protein [Edaphobacter sp.]
MQCPVCHNEVAAGNSFCNHCGAPMTAAGAAPAGAVPPAQGYAVQPVAPVAAAGSGLSDTAAAAISYLTIIPAILFLVMEPYNKKPFIRFHSFQSIGLCVLWIAIWIAVTVLQMVLHFIPMIWFLFSILHLCIALGFFILWLLAILKASKGEWYKIPFIGDFALKQANG